MKDLIENKFKKPIWIIVVSLVVIIFGIVTITKGGSVIFTDKGRISAGNYVPFILWFNFVAGFAYIMAGVSMFKLKSCSRRLSAVIAVSTLIVFISFAIHIFNGGAFEVRTVIAMTIRSILWIVVATFALRSKALKPINCQC